MKFQMGIQKGKEVGFDTNAKGYERMRPGYPQELYADIFARKPLDASCHALEIGIGGGNATLPILQTGCNVTASELGENFVKLTNEKFAAYPFHAVCGRFEQFEAAPEQYDLIYAASSFHWIEEEFGYQKVYSLLKKGGVFARFANHPHLDKGRPELVEAIQACYREFTGSKPRPEYTEAMAKERAEIALKYGFTDISWHIYTRTRDFTAKEYTALLATYSDHIALPDEIRIPFFDKIEAAIDAHGGIYTLYDTLDLELAVK